MPSQRYIKAAYAERTEEVLLDLLTLSHPSLSQVFRIVVDEKDVVSRGATFHAHPLIVELPPAADGEAPRSRIRLCNLSETYRQAIRACPPAPRPTLVYEQVLAATPDIVEIGPLTFRLPVAAGDMRVIEADLIFADRLGQKMTGLIYSPKHFPGLFP